MHEIGADEAREGEQSGDGRLCRLRDAQQEIGDERHGDLDAACDIGAVLLSYENGFF